jgi:hypothetical protein
MKTLSGISVTRTFTNPVYATLTGLSPENNAFTAEIDPELAKICEQQHMVADA